MPYRKKNGIAVGNYKNNFKPPTIRAKLKPQEKRVADNYLTNGFNKAKAIRESSYNSSPRNASVMATQVLNRPHVKEYVKSVLDKQGLTIDELGRLTMQSINNNIQSGKPSQAVAANMIQFAYKLHDAIPSNKTVSTKMSFNVNSTPKNLSELKDMLKKLSDSNEILLQELKK